MATCNAQTILSQACVNGFKQLVETNPNTAQAVLNQLLCNFIEGGGGGSGQTVVYISDPNSEGLQPSNVEFPAVAYSSDGTGSLYGWNTTLHIWQ